MISPQSLDQAAQREQQTAVLAAICAYIAWGLFSLYFKALDQVSALEILCHRIVWAMVLLSIIITFIRKWHEVIPIITNPRKLGIYALSATLISLNWGFYIYAVVSGQALEGSMGYFIMPLVAVILGGIFFAERFSTAQIIAVLMAFCGVFYQIWQFGDVPWIALTLAFSFGFYGMLRKKAAADSIVGLFLETMLISPIALIAMAYWASQGQLSFIQSGDMGLSGLLMLAGPITAIPLALFAFGARRLRYSTVGLLQYINPTSQFFIAIFIFKEEFDLHNLVTFGFIWAGLALYSQHTYLESRRKKHAHS